MKYFKYINLFLLCYFTIPFSMQGQYHVEAGIEGALPLSSNAKGYKIGGGGSLEVNRTFNSLHTIFLSPGILYIPGEQTDDKYLKFEHNSVEAYPVHIGYAYSLTKNFSPSAGVGPSFFTQPQRTIGISAALHFNYQWHRFILKAGIQRLFHKGHLDLFSVGLRYQIW